MTKRNTPQTSTKIRLMLYFSYAGIVCCFLGINACKKVLDQQPETFISTETAITNKKGAEAAVAGLYNEIQNGSYYGRNFQIISDVSSDIAQSVGTWDFYREMDTYVVTGGNTENGNFWYRAYRAINQANNVIAYVPQVSNATEADKNKYMGQAYFVRALAYFDLTRLYGGVPGVVGTLGVPIVIKPSEKIDESAFPPRSSLQDSYNQVESDLLKAVELLPESYGDNRSQAVKATARALLSRYYLYVNKPDQVISYATQVINDPKYVLSATFSAIFDGKLNAESIFELNFTASDQSGIRNWYFTSALSGRGDLAAHESYYKEATADPKDSRGKYFGYDATSKFYYPTKYQKAGNVDNIHVIRIAEMYLNRAEARVKTNDLTGALADLNRIHTRTGSDALSITGATELSAAILQERKLEFAEEGHRFFDLVRTGQALTKLVMVERRNGPPTSLTNAGRQVFPIPSFEMNSNENMVQNEAYK
ncbi:MAG: RagB/SusD family nutrient uptake outer membrane protein [Chitinophagaceae bacterium]